VDVGSWLRQVRDIPAASQGLDEQDAGIHLPPQDVDLDSLVGERDGLGREDEKVAVRAALVAIRRQLE
jgi:hypothetical protein